MIKQVPDSSEVVIDPVTFTLNRGAARNVINPADENAIEQALLIKDKNPGPTCPVDESVDSSPAYMISNFPILVIVAAKVRPVG